MLEIDQNLLLEIKEEVPDEIAAVEETKTPECDLNPSVQVKTEPSVNWEPEEESRTENLVQQIKEEESYDIEFYEEPEFKYDTTGYTKTDSDDPLAIGDEPTDPENVNEENLEMFECDNSQCFPSKPISKDCEKNPNGPVEKTEKPFQCLECGKWFRWKDYLKQHQQIHSSQKPYSCKECGRKFHRKCQLNDHVKCVHSDEKPYGCGECGKRFSLINILNQHKKRYHAKENLFSCRECVKPFATLGLLNQHTKRVHGNLSKTRVSQLKMAKNASGKMLIS